jgi:hypothetical protein
MKTRLSVAFALAAGLALLLIITVAAWGGSSLHEVAESPPLDDNAPAALSAPVGFTAAFTIRLPILPHLFGMCTTAPVLLNPANASGDNSLCPLLSLYAGSNPNATGMYLQVSSDPAFQQILITIGLSGQGLNSHRLGFNLTPGATYYWRGFLLCGSEMGPQSATWSFTTAVTGTIPPPPALIGPISGTVLSSLPVAMEWAAVPGALDYLVSWQRPGMATTSQWTPQTQLYVSWLAAGAVYDWRVQARNDYAFGPESPRWRFTTPAAAGDALLNEPEPNGTVVERGGALRLR